MLGTDKYKYGKLLEDMKNDVILKKDPFPKNCPSGASTTVSTTMVRMSQMMELPSQL